MRITKVVTLLAVVVAAATQSLVDAAIPAPCSSPHYRRELRDLTDAERTRFFNAIRKILQRPAANKPSVFDSVAYYHNAYAAYTHGTPPFLPYHRLMLHRIEKALQAVDPKVTLPYWDWSADAQAPEASIVLSPTWFGTNGKGTNNCLQDGFYADFKPLYVLPTQPRTCIQRKYDAGNRIKAFASPELVADVVNSAKDWPDFRSKIEGFLHGRAHNGIGGTLASMYSPNDPVFYMHHAFIDKIWYDWQSKDPNTRTYQYYGYDPSMKRNVNLNQKLPPPFSNNYVGDGMSTLHAGLCYRYAKAVNAFKTKTTTTKKRRNYSYDDVPVEPTIEYTKLNCTSQNVTLPAADDRTYIMSLRAPDPLPEEWIKMNHLDEKAVRKDEDRARELVTELNSLEGYVSPSALWNRPSLLEKIAETVNEFHAYVNGQLVTVHAEPGHNTVDSIKQAFIKAGVKIIDHLREHADALRDILGDGVDDVLDKIEVNIEKVYDGAKKLYDVFFGGSKPADSDCNSKNDEASDTIDDYAY